jgi:hypothetical protein
LGLAVATPADILMANTAMITVMSTAMITMIMGMPMATSR